ncbi:FixH family protein [Vibrio sp. 404]|uniref:FixH family protein n=1 Tax=Vibrio marinisediminis TaxID=2758441 RepID=A0A7W2FSR9_9VIBR|nr:FixH family protein [Vibrio marinisediminis]MBA5763474.1 FixH family protein [Vibrio marinisediminis]
MVKPWYKQFWPWFLIALPLTVVVAAFITLSISIENSPSLVTEDYYKKGKGINIDISKVNAANELKLKASVISDGADIIIQFDKGNMPHFPALSAMFAHRTLADQDFSQLITSDALGNYRIKLENSIEGPWFIELTPHDKSWLIQGRVNFPSESATVLMD